MRGPRERHARAEGAGCSGGAAPSSRAGRYPAPDARASGSAARGVGEVVARKPLDELRETIGRFGDQLRRPGGRDVDELVGDLFGGARSTPERPLAEVQA